MTPGGIFFGIILAIFAELSVAFGNIQIKYSHKLNLTSLIHKPVYKRSRWWIGFLGYLFNAIFKFSSYMFASLNILAPISSICIIINAFLAKYYFNEKLTIQGIIGSVLIIIGCIFCIAFGEHKVDAITIESLFKYADTLKFILFTALHIISCIVFAIIGLYLVISSKHRNAPDPAINHNVYREMSFSPSQKNGIDDHDPIPNKSPDSHPEHVQEPSSSAMHHNLLNAASQMGSISLSNLLKSEEAKNELLHVMTCLLLTFTTAGVTAWVQMLGKISADLLWESVFMNNNQFTSITPFIIIILLGGLLCLELYLISEIMRLFDATLVVPIFNSLLILTTIAVNAAYFNNFTRFATVNLVMFIFGLLFMIIGMILLMMGQKHASMQHRKIDRDMSPTGLLPNRN